MNRLNLITLYKFLINIIYNFSIQNLLINQQDEYLWNINEKYRIII